MKTIIEFLPKYTYAFTEKIYFPLDAFRFCFFTKLTLARIENHNHQTLAIT